jgi:Protein of unknown function (DUF2380)
MGSPWKSGFLSTVRNVFTVGALLAAGDEKAVADDTTPQVPVAVADFYFLDTSGEVRNQTSEHQQRLQHFAEILRTDLARAGRFGIVGIKCSMPCPANDLLAKAREAGSHYLIVGAIQKESSLVLWAKLDVIDLRAGKSVLNQWITFRGDTDEAWKRAARFTARSINDGLPN